MFLSTTFVEEGLTVSDVGCKEIAVGIKRAAGWVFAQLLHHYFGATTVVLVGAGEGGTNLELSISESWLEANHANRFGFTNDMALGLTEHVESCKDPQCAEAEARLRAVEPFYLSGKLPRGDALAVVGACTSRQPEEKCAMARENGFSEAIDGLRPFFLWFLDDREFWAWPK